jgi:hypothetical protein
VHVLQLLDPAERSLEFGKAAEWEDMETGRRIYLDPDQARAGYRARMEGHLADVRRVLDQRGVPLQVIQTDQPLDFALLEWMRRSGDRRSLRTRARQRRTVA